MDRHRGERQGGDRISGDRMGGGGGGGGGGDLPPRRMPSSRWSDDGPNNNHHRFPRGGGGGGKGGSGEFTGGEGRFHPYRGPQDYPTRGGGGPGFRSAPGDGFQVPMGGPKRGFFGRGAGSPEYADGNKFAKLFVGSVPRTVTEEDIRPLFEEHGNVIEVALIRDRRSGQQQGFCFVKYATSEEADRAIAALHNQHTLPGALTPLQVRYADGDRERHEDKLFVASLNKRSTEQEIAEIFSPYGHVEDVYLMRDELKQSRGCGFVKFSNREMAAAAMNALHGTYVMMGCDQPLIVRFADPKRPRTEQRGGGPAFGGPGFGERSETATVIGSTAKFDEPRGGHIPPNAWGSSPQSRGPSSQAGGQGFGTNPSAKGGMVGTSSVATGPLAETGLTGGHQPNFAAPPQQGFNPSVPQMHPGLGLPMPVLQKPLMNQQHLPSSLQLPQSQQISGSHLQGQTMQPQMQQMGQLQVPQSTGLPSNQSLPSQQLPGFSGQLSASQPLMQPNAYANALQIPLSQQGMAAMANQQQLPSSTLSPQMLQRPIQQIPSQPPHVLLQQQAQALQSSYQSSQQAIFQLQQQLQLMQQAGLTQQQIPQNVKQQQSPWNGPQPSSAPASTTAAIVPAAAPVTSMPVTTTSAVPLTCNWTEHTSPQGFKYYYNSVTQESKWEKPGEYSAFEQQQQQQQMLLFQQQQQKVAVQQLQSLAQTQSQTQNQPNPQISQAQQVQNHMQLRQQAQMQLFQPSLAYQTSGLGNKQNIQDFNRTQLQAVNPVADNARSQPGIQAAQELSWQNKPQGYQHDQRTMDPKFLKIE